MADAFRKLAKRVADWTGSASAFLWMVLIVIIWASSGPYYHFSENWQMVINTSTNVITFLMVFLIQNSQNRDSKMLHLKMDELIRANRKARNIMIDLDRHTDEELTKLHEEFVTIKQHTTNELDKIEELQRKVKLSRSET